MALELSQYQKDIIKFYKENPSANMQVNALAGAGKSYILKQLSDLSTKSDIYMAFNNTVAKEMETKITNPKVKIKTFHALAYSYMMYNMENHGSRNGIGKQRNTNNKPVLDNLKPYKILEKFFENRKWEDFDEKFWLTENYVKLYNLVRLTRTEVNGKSIARLVRDHNLFSNYEFGFAPPSPDQAADMIIKLDNASLNEFELHNTIDFTDMLYITFLKISDKEWSVPPWGFYTNIFVDESQDMNNLQLLFLKFIKRKGGRYVFVGDFHQCQPYGTKIALIDEQWKNIEDIEIGDKVVQYNRNRGNDNYGNSSFVGHHSKGLHNDYCVVDKQEFFTDKLIRITAETNESSSYTPNHMCYVKFNRETTQNATCLYLMENNSGYFRIGTVKMYSSQSSLGIKYRTKAENFHRCWILNIYDNEKDAWVNEQKYSLKYQIPQIIFQDWKTKYTDEDRAIIYEAVFGQMRGRAIALLDEFGRDINFPLYERGNVFSHTARDHGFETAASNIIAKYMDCLVYDPNNRKLKNLSSGKKELTPPVPIYRNITKVEAIYGLVKVVGITTNYNHTYVADGIVTHNSIYSFAGANANSFHMVDKLFAPLTSFNLPICYRCPTLHLDKVNKEFHIPIKPRPDAPKGSIKYIEKEDIVKYVKVGDLIIARKNKWLTDVILSLASNGIPIFMQDKELVDNILKMVDKKKSNTAKGIYDKLTKSKNKYQKQMMETIRQAHDDNGNQINQVVDTNAKVDQIDFVLKITQAYLKNNPYALKSDLIRYLTRLLNTTDIHDCVRITSVHKAKGLEADHVFVLNEGQICKDFRHSPEQAEQEVNLSYISLTRSKDVMYLVAEEES